MVTPVGFEPNIADLRGRPPKPLEDGAIKLLSLSRQLGFLGHGLSINFAAPILVLPSLAHMRVHTGMLGEFFKLFSFNLTYLLYHNFLKFSRNGVFCQHSVLSWLRAVATAPRTGTDFAVMVTQVGIEPNTSGLKGLRLNHLTTGRYWCAIGDLNPGLPD